MNKNKSGWELLGDEQMEDFKIFNLRKSTRKNPRTKKSYTFFLMSGLDWVNIIALTKNKEIILVSQFRHGADCQSLELPGGCVEINEDPIDAARRELAEETGYTVGEIKELGQIYANPALQSMKVGYFLAFDAVQTLETKLDPGEDIQTLKMPLYEFYQKIKDGEVVHALMVAASGMLMLKHPELSG